MDVTTAINGHQAFEILSKQTEDDLFDIVILDLNMPISDGFETCKNIIKFFKCQGIFKIDQSFVSNISSSHGQNLPLKIFKPVIVALSSLITKDIEKKTDLAGFNLTLQSPLHAKVIENLIMPLLQTRKDQIEFESQAHIYKQQALDLILDSNNSRKDLE